LPSSSSVDFHAPFVDNLILLASIPKGLHRQIDALTSFCDLQQLMVNLDKTKVMIINASNSFLATLCFLFQVEESEIMTTYTYLGVQFVGPCFGMPQALTPLLNKGVQLSCPIQVTETFSRHHPRFIT
jgi:hypothetical protein